MDVTPMCEPGQYVLHDSLSIVFFGTAAGKTSARTGAYYAQQSNKFWDVLSDSGLTPMRLCPREFKRLTEFGIGLTDLCKTAYGTDNEIKITKADCDELKRKIVASHPRFLAFTSLRAGRVYCGHKSVFGKQATKIGDTEVYVLPSTSLMAAWNWEENKMHWTELARVVRAERNS